MSTTDEIVAHLCSDGKFKPYGSVWCSECPPGTGTSENNYTLDDLAKTVRNAVLHLTDDQRKEFLEALDFCRYCGSDTADGGCYCMRDD